MCQTQLGACRPWLALASMPPLDPCPVTMLQKPSPPSLIPRMSDHQLGLMRGMIKGNACPLYPTKRPTTKTSTTPTSANTHSLYLHLARPGPPTYMSNNSIIDTIQTVVGVEVPNATIKTIQALSTASPRRVFGVTLSDGRFLTLSFSQAATPKLLRSELSLIRSEALLVRWLMAAALSCQQPANMKTSSSTSTTTSISVSQSPKYIASQDICRYLPTLISHSSSPTELGSSLNLVEPTKGLPISALLDPLSRADRNALDYSKGCLARRLSQFTSPSGTFGTAISVLAHTSPSYSSSSRASAPEPPLGDGGVRTWETAFHSLLESALRDGEDMAVNISYSRIRKHFSRLAHLLAAVTTPRLVVLHPYSDDNIMISPPIGAHVATKEIKTKPPCVTDRDTVGMGKQHDKSSRPGRMTCTEAVDMPSGATLVGLDDWSSCIFGDPLLASDFTHHATGEYLRGFGISPSSALGSRILNLCGRETEECALDDKCAPFTMRCGLDLIEDSEHAYARILLYECYHAVVDVVRQFYRPTSRSTDREMAARRRLTRVLQQLEQVGDIKVKTEIRPLVHAPSPPSSLPPLSPGGETVDDRNSVRSESEASNHVCGGEAREASNAGRQSPVAVKQEDGGKATTARTGSNAHDPKRPRRPSADAAMARPQKKARGDLHAGT
ncbi:hypothetical protein MN608_08781 [Microdochium nivale]|nr:hypothetical protein MN608_08781 [Microdochium nivale]